MQQVVVAEKQGEEHPARVFVRDLFVAEQVRVSPNEARITLFLPEAVADYIWLADNQIELNGDVMTYFGWFDFATAKQIVEDFEKRQVVKVALPIGKFMDPIAGRFVKDLVASRNTFNGLDKIRLEVGGRRIEWSWFEGHVVRDEEHLGHSSYFTMEVAKFLMDAWTDRED